MIKKSKIQIKINEERCTGCIICKLWCSFSHYKIFNPSRANLEIEERYSLTPRIIFLDTCTNCGKCAQHCLYGALKIVEDLK
ncbi:MAG: 4Fe-4S dicluster domain-containing protein [Promethearchaeota archaeon]